MSIRLLIITLIILIIGTTIICVVLRKLKKASKVIVLGTVIILGVAYSTYLFNPSFRQMVNIRLNSASQHRCTINNQSFNLPLPDKTILCYRTSDTQAVYTTKASYNEILTFYSSIAEDDSLLNSNEKEELKLLFKYHGESIIVTVEDNTSSREITVDII